MMAYIFYILTIVSISSVGYAEEISLSELIDSAYAENLSLKAMRKKIIAAKESASAVSTFKDPTVGISELNRGSKTRYWSIGQKLEFSQKYSLKESIQETRAGAQSSQFEQHKLDIRSAVITKFYAIYAIQRIKAFTKDDLAKIKEFSRIAESKYAAGTAPMQDSMKAHFTQTQVESNLISLNQEEDALQAQMQAMLNKPSSFRIQTNSEGILVPRIPLDKLNSANIKTHKSPTIKQKQYEVEEADYQHSLAKWKYAPDFQLKYQGRLSGAPDESHIVSLEMSVPLWFWGKLSDERSSLNTKISKKYELEATTKNLDSMLDTLKSKVKNQAELLAIFETSLIPQAVTSYESSADAYKASSITFLSLLDSERSLLKVRIAYYRTLTQYIESLTKLESVLGYPISALGK